MVKRTNGSAREKLRQQVRREESVCHLCDQWVDVTLPAVRPGSPEVDHVIPIYHGGPEHDRASARLSHRYCNRLRSFGPISVARELLASDPPIFGPDGFLLDSRPSAVATRQWL